MEWRVGPRIPALISVKVPAIRAHAMPLPNFAEKRFFPIEKRHRLPFSIALRSTITLVLVAYAFCTCTSSLKADVDFNRQIRPILAEY